MRALVFSLVIVALVATLPQAQRATSDTLTVYVVDVEGGNATLLVSPSGQSLLIDTGNPGARDADRILGAAKDAGLTQIDNLITTHYHGDHIGGVVDLTARIPIRRFIDHGPSVESSPATNRMLEQYAALYGKAAHTVARAGDVIPIAGLDVRVAASAGRTIKIALAGGGGSNARCGSFAPKDPDTSENAQSLGSVITLGRFRMVHLGDLTWNKEFELMCPTNPIGTVDLLMVSHHGLNQSNSEVLVHGLQPRVAIMNNGIRKGGTPDTMRIIYSSPNLEDLWQLHFSQLGGQEYAAPGLFIANELADPTVAVAQLEAPTPGTPSPPAPVHDGAAFWIKVSAQRTGTFTVTNSRNGFSKTYPARTR
jgi:competence protein ComEC